MIQILFSPPVFCISVYHGNSVPSPHSMLYCREVSNLQERSPNSVKEIKYHWNSGTVSHPVLQAWGKKKLPIGFGVVSSSSL